MNKREKADVAEAERTKNPHCNCGCKKWMRVGRGVLIDGALWRKKCAAEQGRG